MARLCALLMIVGMGVSAETPRVEPPPKELMLYIADAKKLGLTDEQIRRNTAAAGWSAAIVAEAMAASAGGPISERAAAAAEPPDGYRIGPGDMLQISVWREPDASAPSVTVRADGKVSLPLVKEVEIAGLTPAAAERMLAERLGRYIHGADVTVVVREIHSQKVYLVGGVRTVGAVPLKGPMTVLQALTEAGGLNDFAKRKQIYVLRNENGRQVKLPFNYDAVIKGENMDQNIILFPSDTIVVPQ